MFALLVLCYSIAEALYCMGIGAKTGIEITCCVCHEGKYLWESWRKRLTLRRPIFLFLKTGKAKSIRFSTLEAICKALSCRPGDIVEYHAGKG